MRNLFFAAIAALGLSAPAHAVTQAEVIDNISNHVILQTYRDFARSSRDLKSAVDTFVAEPTQDHLDAAQNAWRAARAAYEVSEGFLFGPMDALGIDPMIDTWPLALKDLKLILASNHDLDVDFVRTLGSNVVGFHAIEYLLFGEGIVTNTKDLALFTPREMRYLTSAAVLLTEQTDLLLSAWTEHFDPEDLSSPAYIDVLARPGANNAHYSTEQSVIDEFVNGIIAIVAEAGDGKLPDPTGDDIENANARLEESPFSWNSINDFTSNVDSVRNIYLGSYGSHRGPGLKDLVAQKDPALADKVERQIAECRALIQAIPGPSGISFGRAIRTQDGRARIFAAIKGLVTLRKTLEDEVVPALAP